MNEVRKYSVTFNKTEYNTTYTFKRCKSGAFEYGNGTCVIVERADGYDELYDTRYDSGVVNDFEMWCLNWLETHFNPDYEPTWKEI